MGITEIKFIKFAGFERISISVLAVTKSQSRDTLPFIFLSSEFYSEKSLSYSKATDYW